jgi:hypothetical protein
MANAKKSIFCPAVSKEKTQKSPKPDGPPGKSAKIVKIPVLTPKTGILTLKTPKFVDFRPSQSAPREWIFP